MKLVFRFCLLLDCMLNCISTVCMRPLPAVTRIVVEEKLKSQGSVGIFSIIKPKNMLFFSLLSLSIKLKPFKYQIKTYLP